MKLGTIMYSDKIYNLDNMSLDEMKTLLNNIENEKKEKINIAKNLLKTTEE